MALTNGPAELVDAASALYAAALLSSRDVGCCAHLTAADFRLNDHTGFLGSVLLRWRAERSGLRLGFSPATDLRQGAAIDSHHQEPETQFRHHRELVLDDRIQSRGQSLEYRGRSEMAVAIKHAVLHEPGQLVAMLIEPPRRPKSFVSARRTGPFSTARHR